MLVLMPTVSRQPEEWVFVKSYSYDTQNEVDLAYTDKDGIGITQLHKVRCINASGNEMYTPKDCKFQDGDGTLQEDWITKDPVERRLWAWQVKTDRY